ncbi:MAG: tRNA uridine-5-carboxymethylaminomethyl(34) synthesis GTPase MnmE [Pseudomonadales bacterium]|nr:tRNA uridine-5-carboxymethylaminomethyl(34) synthesis GTPase MnmE [Pseudomonadales bacterium]
MNSDTIVAIATPPGKGGVGIIRISGIGLEFYATKILGKIPKTRLATLANFADKDGGVIDQGLALFFKTPNSFTGEDVLELQGHGGPVVMDMLLQRVIALGARIARPGEFSERAFLNEKIDLSQAEAIADLIDSVSQQAAKGAMRSLRGEFSDKIRSIDRKIVETRTYVEAAIDFPEEEIDFLSDKVLLESLKEIECKLELTLEKATEGALLREGVTIVLAGRPNVGKSSLMNRLSGRESSIVTSLAGTTRDLVNEHIHLDGVPLKLIDTAGIRDARDEVEEEGIRRAKREMADADGIVLLIDLSTTSDWQREIKILLDELPENDKVLVVLNKTDLVNPLPQTQGKNPYPIVHCSALLGTGVSEVKESLKSLFGLEVSEEGAFVARSRHLDALKRAQAHMEEGNSQLSHFQAGELLAEELRLCHDCMCEITGEYSSDDLLGEIFSSFCIGK